MAAKRATFSSTEKTDVNCSFFVKTGACLFKKACTNRHFTDSSTQTILLKRFYLNELYNEKKRKYRNTYKQLKPSVDDLFDSKASDVPSPVKKQLNLDGITYGLKTKERKENQQNSEATTKMLSSAKKPVKAPRSKVNIINKDEVLHKSQILKAPEVPSIHIPVTTKLKRECLWSDDSNQKGNISPAPAKIEIKIPSFLFTNSLQNQDTITDVKFLSSIPLPEETLKTYKEVTFNATKPEDDVKDKKKEDQFKAARKTKKDLEKWANIWNVTCKKVKLTSAAASPPSPPAPNEISMLDGCALMSEVDSKLAISVIMSMANGNVGDGNGLKWHVGLLNSRYKYLTAETFGCKVNANGVALKKKQLWSLEPFGGDAEEEAVCLKSHLGKFLAVDQFGNVTCDSEEKEPGSKFKVVVNEDGRWAFKNTVRGYFLGGSDDKLVCSAKAPGEGELWTVHLAARPQVNLRSVGRRRYARLSAEQDEIQVDANTPWGEDALFTLEFRENRYAVHACNGKYLRSDGKLSEECECLFGLEFHGGHLALRDPQGRYVSPIGSKAVLRTRSQTVTKDELFSLEDSVPQAAFAGFNGKYVSVKQGVDLTANQDEISDHETFQLEYNEKSKSWHIRTMQDKYWSLDSSGGIQANASKGPSSAHFELEWLPEGSMTFKANNGKYVAAKKSGHLYANSDKVEDMEKFYFYLINRQTLVLKCEQGFVGYKSAASPKLECNKATYESIFIERGEKGICYFKGNNGKYWHTNPDNSISVDAEFSQAFYIELREPSKLCIKTKDGNYVVADKNGLFKVGGSEPASATTWEY